MKLKTHSGAKKRVKKTGTGKLRMEKGSKRHLLANKSKKQKRIGGRKQTVSPSRAGALRKLLPNK